MPLLGSAAMLLSFDVAQDAVADHDSWHTHEHLPERLSIPGFLRGTRWTALKGGPRYLVLYEVADLSVLSSTHYLERLNNPTPWTSKVMPHYRGMQRGLCAVRGSFGFGMGWACGVVRFRAEPFDPADAWLRGHLPRLPDREGVGSAHLLHAAAAPAMTNEQRLRGADAVVHSAAIVTGYELASVDHAGEELRAGLLANGCTDATLATYQAAYSLSCAEMEGEPS